MNKSTNEPVACFVETEQGVMVWPIDDINEAGTYCEENEFPVLLYTHPQDQKKDEALRLALEAIKKLVFLAEHEGWEGFDKQYEAITLIEQALENK